MEKQHPYNKSIENKLQQLPDADVNELWSSMHAVLDKRMPQQKRRRFAGWFMKNKGILFFSILFLVTICIVPLYFISTKTTINKQAAETTTAFTPKKQNQKELLQTTPGNSNSLPQHKQRITTGSFETPVHVSDPENKSLKTLPTEKNTPGAIQSKERGSKNLSPVIAALHEELPLSNNYNTEDLVPKKNISSVVPFFTPSVYGKMPVVSQNKNFAVQIDSLPGNNSRLKNLLRQERDSIAAAINKKQKDRGWYAGFIAGVDLSSIKFNGMRSGNNKGFIVGYSLNKKWGIETGLLWNKKRFSADGIYFRPSGYTLPQGVEMLRVAGENRMYEWPVNLRFTILAKRHHLFATTGLSSYFMKMESYEHEYRQNGQYAKSYTTYRNQTKNWFSIANFSLAYNYRLGTTGSIRVEPYIKLPIKNIGFNNMPVVSTGLNLGFTKQLSK